MRCPAGSSPAVAGSGMAYSVIRVAAPRRVRDQLRCRTTRAVEVARRSAKPVLNVRTPRRSGNGGADPPAGMKGKDSLRNPGAGRRVSQWNPQELARHSYADIRHERTRDPLGRTGAE